MLTNGDKLIVIKKVANFLDEGDIVEIVDVGENGMISFAFGEGFMHKGIMNMSECEEHFKKFEDITAKIEAPTITEECIAEIMENSEFEIHTVFDKCTIVSCRLPNGFVITESSACVSPENYDEDIGVEICYNKIVNKIWELEGYRLQQWMWENENKCCCEECENCSCDCECDCEREEEIDECLDTDLDCDDCLDFECPFNTNTCH